MQVAFSVAKTGGRFSGASKLSFDTFTADVLSEFNLTTGDFFARQNGTYVAHICTRNLNTDLFATLYINNTEHSFLEQETYVEGETAGRDSMMYHETNWQSYYYHQHVGISDAQGLQTAWTMFRLDDLIQPLIGFSVTSGSYMTGPNYIEFDKILVNHGNGWKRNRFIVPVSGTYFLSLCTFTNGYTKQRMQIDINNNPLVEVTVSDAEQWSDTFSNTFLKQLSQSDEVRVYLLSGSIGNNDFDATNFIGFLYEPVHEIKVVWSVHRTTNATGSLEPVSFDYIMTNIGGGWNSINHEFVAPINGIYYLHLNAASQAA